MAKTMKVTWKEHNEQACRTLGCIEKVSCFAGKHAPLCQQAKTQIEKQLEKERENHG